MVTGLSWEGMTRQQRRLLLEAANVYDPPRWEGCQWSELQSNIQASVWGLNWPKVLGLQKF